MRKITRRAVSLLLIAALTVAGLALYAIRYIEHGRDWALAFSRANAGVSGALTDRNGELLASFDATENRYAADAETRVACYAVTGDYWGRSGTGALSCFWDELQGYSLVTGTTRSESAALRLTVDAALCHKAFAALEGQKGAVMLMNYRSGEVLCMVSAPAVDPLDNAEPPDGAFLNRCLSCTFVPGSVFKLVTAAAALEQIPDIEDWRFTCEGKTEIAGVTVKCSGTHGTQSFEEALGNSCNVAFAKIAIRLGQRTIHDYADAFGLLDRHELDGIPCVAGSFSPDYAGDPELAWAGIGQSTDLVNPYAMLRYVAAIANGGVLAEPHLIAGRSGPDTPLLDADTAARLGAMMNYNVRYYYGGEDMFPGLRLCAKTGTAETGSGQSHAWMCGYLADDKHPYAFVVMVEDGGSGLYGAGPVVNALLQAAVR